MIKEKFDLTGKTAFVTGSARGIGRAVAAAFAEFGARVIVHGARPSGPLEESLAAVRAYNAACDAVTGDLGVPEEVEAIFARLRELDALPDILVANASIQKNIHWSAFDAAEAHHEMEVNFHATLRLFQLAYPKMKAQGWGRLISVGSNVARQVAREGITVNNLCPGAFATDRNAAALSNPVYREKVLNAIPMHDTGRPEDAAGAALLLASDAGRYITGATLMVDGGLRLPG